MYSLAVDIANKSMNSRKVHSRQKMSQISFFTKLFVDNNARKELFCLKV